jgi:thiaminase (transcriptional activator TenA)
LSLSNRLWEDNADLARTALDHGFVRGLAEGTLPLASFRHYVAQDAYFLESFARAYALALAHSPDGRGLRDFAGLISGVLEELELHAGYAERWGVGLEGIEPDAATLAYTDFLLSTAALGGAGLTCAAMTPCMRLYAHLGHALAEGGYDSANSYAEWIETYSDPEFEALASRLESLLDRYGGDGGPELRRAYRRAMSLELGFFEAGLRAGCG